MIVAGAVLVPALSLPDALVAIVVGCVIGNLMLAAAGMIGADARVPGMALMRAPLGQRGSLLPTAVNVVQGVGWTVFELLVIATAAAALSDELFGFRAQWLWTIVFGACALVLALLGPIGFVRRFIRRFAIWAVPLALGYLTWWALDGADLGASWDAEGTGGLTVWQGADVVVGITVSWVPYAADYTRFTRTRRGAFAGTGIGYLVPDVWLLVLGAVLVLSRDLGDPAALPAAVVAGGFAAIVALFALLVTETDEAFANAYSASVSLQNAFPRLPQALLIVLVTAVATAGALIVDIGNYQSFLLLLGSVFVPLFAVLLADWLAAGAHYTADDVFASARLAGGPHRCLARGVRALPVALPDRARLVGRSRQRAESARLGHRCHRPQLRRLVRHRAHRRPRDAPRYDRSRRRMTAIAALGHITRDVVDGAEPRPGGGVFYAARALARLGADAHVEASCSAEHRSALVPPLEAFGLPTTWHESSTTTEYSFHYEGDRRIMSQDAIGDPWTPEQAVEAAADATWIDVCALTRTDFPPETLAALSAGARRLLVDLQGLVRTPTIGPLHRDDQIGDVLHHIDVLKLNDDEAKALVGNAEPETLHGLGVPEVILTLGSQGAWVVMPGFLEHVPAVPVDGDVDPTGAGDTYSVTYIVQRTAGAEPVEAARIAAATVSEFLSSP